jgi:hypothetical protein
LRQLHFEPNRQQVWQKLYWIVLVALVLSPTGDRWIRECTMGPIWSIAHSSFGTKRRTNGLSCCKSISPYARRDEKTLNFEQAQSRSVGGWLALTVRRLRKARHPKESRLQERGPT